jgi:hypothetical protein
MPNEIPEGFHPCRLCKDAFGRIRYTKYYCSECGNSFCIGEHGNFAFGHGKCVVCGVRPDYTEDTEEEEVEDKKKK